MSARDTLDRLYRSGFQAKLTPDGERVWISPAPVPAELVEMVRVDKADIVALLTEQGPLHPPTGAPFMPWCAPISGNMLVAWRDELVEMIEELSDRQGWPREHLDNVLARAINGPISDLRPTWHYFNGELRRAREAK